MTFNIGRQSAGVINNVGGDQRIAGGQRGLQLTTAEQARQVLSDLCDALAAIPLEQGTASAVRAEMAELDGSLRAASPDRSRFAAALDRLTRLLAAAGPVASAATALAGPLHTLAGYLMDLMR